jgi:hypothetical protein
MKMSVLWQRFVSLMMVVDVDVVVAVVGVVVLMDVVLVDTALMGAVLMGAVLMGAVLMDVVLIDTVLMDLLMGDVLMDAVLMDVVLDVLDVLVAMCMVVAVVVDEMTFLIINFTSTADSPLYLALSLTSSDRLIDYLTSDDCLQMIAFR